MLPFKLAYTFIFLLIFFPNCTCETIQSEKAIAKEEIISETLKLNNQFDTISTKSLITVFRDLKTKQQQVIKIWEYPNLIKDWNQFMNNFQSNTISLSFLKIANNEKYDVIIATELKSNENEIGTISVAIILDKNDKLCFLNESVIDYLKGIYFDGTFVETKDNNLFLLLSYGARHSGTYYNGTDIYRLSSKPSKCLEVKYSLYSSMEYCMNTSYDNICYEWRTDILIADNKAALLQKIHDSTGGNRTKVQHFPLCNGKKVTLTSD